MAYWDVNGLNPEIMEFEKRVKDMESAYKSARVRTLLVDTSNGFVSCITRIDLLPTEAEESTNQVWPSKSLKIVEVTMEYSDIKSLVRYITSGGLCLDDLTVGFEDSDSPQWQCNVYFRNDRIGSIFPENTTLRLRGVADREKLIQKAMDSISNEIRLHKILPFPSIQDLIQKFFGLSRDNINVNLVDIYAPSYVQITDLKYLGSDVVVRFKCMKETADDMRIKAVFSSSNGGFLPHAPRLRKSPVVELPDGSVEVEKSFPVPDEATESIGVDVTLSLKGRSGLDTAYTHNLPIVNPIWYTLGLLDKTKVSKHFKFDSFEDEMIRLSDGDVFEAIMASLLTSCGFKVAWTGGFGLSCEDFLAFDDTSNVVLVSECTIGSPRHKIGLMKTALSSLSSRAKGLRFVGVVFTSKSTSDPERQGALKDYVIIRDASDIKSLVQMAAEAPNPRKVYAWLGLDVA